MVRQRTEDLIRILLDQGLNVAIVGGALGYDLMVLRLLIEIKKVHEKLKVVGFFPFPGYDSKWTHAQKEEYSALIPQLDRLIFTAPSDMVGNEAFLERNRKMVDESSVLICYYNENRRRSGTGQCVRYAQKQNLEIINIANTLH